MVCIMVVSEAMASSLCELIERLSLSDDKMSVLTQIKSILSSTSNEELWSIVSALQLNALYESVDATDSDQLEACCSILDRLFGALDVNVLITAFTSDIILGLSHTSPAVNEVSLNQVARVAVAYPQHLASHLEILQKVANLIGHESVTVSSKACKIFTSLGQNAEGLEVIFSNQILPQLNEVMSKSDGIRFRVYEMVVDIAMLSPEALNRSSESFYLQSLVAELNKKDVLVQLNSLELLSKLSLSDLGFQFMESVGLIHRVEQLLISAENDSIKAMLLVPGILRFFGGLCYTYPKEMCVRLELFMKKIFSALDPHLDDGSEFTDIALDSVGLIGSTPDGKMALDKHHDSMVTVCRYIGQLMNDAPTARRSRVLSVIAQLMHLQVESQTTELLTITKDWFSHLLDSDPLKKILAVAKQPFAELHVPGLEVIKSLALLPWGQDYLNCQPGFEEYLLDRNTEKSKEGMEMKYEIVKTLIHSPTAAGIFSSETMMRMKTFERQGPFYAPMQTIVAFDST